jgi:flagellar basal body-associated protein FliL
LDYGEKEKERGGRNLMGLLRGLGYFVAILILIAGILILPIGLVLIVPAVIMLWMLKKGGEVASIKKDMKAVREIEEMNARRQVELQRQDALKYRQNLEQWK